MSYIEGSEVIVLASVSAVTIIFGAFGIYLAESGRPDSTINNLYDALWWSIETITTVAYGEYYPVTEVGRIISSLMMFAAIAFPWIFVGILGPRIVAKRVKEKENGDGSTSHTILLDKTKEFIKSKVDTSACRSIGIKCFDCYDSLCSYFTGTSSSIYVLGF
jgi:voltage-gated potassium channel